jgi:hypothetical protein
MGLQNVEFTAHNLKTPVKDLGILGSSIVFSKLLLN